MLQNRKAEMQFGMPEMELLPLGVRQLAEDRMPGLHPFRLGSGDGGAKFPERLVRR